MSETRSGFVHRAITRLAGWAVGVFQRIESEGGPIPQGPVLVVANHPNSLLDPLIVFRVAGRPTRPLAKAPLFQQALVGTMLRALGGLPVYRKQDDPQQMHRNDETFAAAIAALHAGDAIQIYPEGRSHSEPALAPLRTGAARIALGAEAESGWTLGLQVVPIGFNYRRKSLFRGHVLALIGRPFHITSFRGAWGQDPQAAVRALTDEIADRLEEVTLNLARHDDLELIETADRLYARQKGLQSWREREDMVEKLPRLQTFARGLAWLRANDPDRHARLERAVRRYQRALALYGASEADVPPRYPFGTVLRYVLREAVLLGAGAPFALAGSLLWLPAYLAPRAVLPIVRPEYEAVATYKLATGIFVVPITCAVAALLAWKYFGVPGAILAPVVALALGFLTLAWHERWRRVREDARVFLIALTHRRGRDRHASLRAALTAEFDDVLSHIRDPGGSAATTGRVTPST
jgi:1-acyl-sn-glycerol-3-phosphate acyltransferase